MDRDVLNGAPPAADTGGRESLILCLTGTILALTVASRVAAKFELLALDELDELLSVSQMCAERVRAMETPAPAGGVAGKRRKR